MKVYIQEHQMKKPGSRIKEVINAITPTELEIFAERLWGVFKELKELKSIKPDKEGQWRVSEINYKHSSVWSVHSSSKIVISDCL